MGSARNTNTAKLCLFDLSDACFTPGPKDQKIGGARRDRTDDLMLAKHALSQLSYGPEGSFVSSPK